MTTNDDQTPKDTAEANSPAGVSCADAYGSGGCPPNCGHTEMEHDAFDWGLKDGENGGASAIPAKYQSPSLREAYNAGMSVGMLNYRDSLQNDQSLATAGAGISKT